MEENVLVENFTWWVLSFLVGVGVGVFFTIGFIKFIKEDEEDGNIDDTM